MAEMQKKKKGEKEDEMKVTLEEKKVEMKVGDEKMGEMKMTDKKEEKVVDVTPVENKTESVGGGMIPNNTVPPVVTSVVAKTANLPDKALADVADTTNDMSTPLQSIQADAVVNMTNTLHGGIKLGHTPVRKFAYFEWDEVPIADFSRPDELDDNIRERAIMDYPKWSKMPVDLPVKENPLKNWLSKITDDEVSGVPVLRWINKELNREERAENIQLIEVASLAMDQILIDDQADTYETHLYFNDPVNARLLTDFSADWEQDLRDPAELHAILRQMNNSMSTLVPLTPDQLDPRYNKIWHERTDESYNLIMDRSYKFRHAMIDMNLSLIRSYVPMTAEAELTTVNHLFQLLRVKETVRDFTSEIPRGISSTKATDFYANLINACTMSRWGGLYMQVDFTDLNSTMILECILLKLLVPYSAMHHESVIAVDNYIAKYVIPRLPGYRPNLFVLPQFRELDRGDVNYLTEMLNINDIVDNYDVVRQFFLTTGTGGGWNTSEVCDRVQFMPGTADYINQRDIQYVPIGGIDNEEERQLDFPQFTRFCAFVEAVVQKPFKTDENSRRLADCVKVLDFIARQTTRSQGYAYYTNRVLKRLGLCAHTYPCPVNLDNPDNAKPSINYEKRIFLYPGGIMSSIFLLDFEKTNEDMIGKDFLKMGWCINHWFANLTEITQLVKEMLTFKKWKRSDKVAKIKEMMTANLSIAPALHTMIGAYPALYDMLDFEIPTRDVHDMSDRRMTRGIRRLEEHIRTNLIRFGVVEHFYYDPRMGDREIVYLEHLSIHFQQVVHPDLIGEEIDWYRLVDLHSTSTYQPLVERMQNEGKIIKYNIPIKLKPVEMSRIALLPSELAVMNPIDYLPGNQFIGIKDLTTYYFWREKFDLKNDNYLAHSEKPRWISDAMYPFVWRKKDLDFADFIGHRFNFRKDGFKIVDKFEYGNLY